MFGSLVVSFGHFSFLFFVFFFKQKTAYEMRISDWSSDVCSSDEAADAQFAMRTVRGIISRRTIAADRWFPAHVGLGRAPSWMGTTFCRSEEHTSELQSLMRISYAVFCLNTKIYN